MNALIFVPALAGSTIFGFIFLLFVAGYYLQVLEGTAAGAKEIPWEPSESISNFTKVLYLAWLIGLWAGPAYFLGRALTPGTDSSWLRPAAPLLIMWALYPVSQLASLSASSVWMPLTPDVFARLAQKPMVTAGFFALSLPVVAVFGVAFRWAFLTSGEWHLLLVGSSLVALAALMYARLLGRLAFALMFTKDLLKRKKKKKPKLHVPVATALEDREPVEAQPVTQPSDLPPIETRDGEIAGYNILVADDAPAPKRRVRAQVADNELSERPQPPARAPNRSPDQARVWDDGDDDATPYGVSAQETTAEEPAPRPSEVIKPRVDELALIDRSDEPKPPKVMWSMEVLAFLAQPGTLSALVILSGLGVLAGTLVRVARALTPVTGNQ